MPEIPAPLKDELVFVPAKVIEKMIDFSGPYFSLHSSTDSLMNDPISVREARRRFRDGSNVLVAGSWDLTTNEFASNKTRAMVFRKLEEGLSWEQVGAYDWMQRSIEKYGKFDGCANRGDVIERFRTLDKIIKDCRSGNGLLPQSRVNPSANRERGGIAVAIGRNGDVISASAGLHRLSIAQFFDLDEIPVCLSVVHPAALRNRKWEKHLIRREDCGFHRRP